MVNPSLLAHAELKVNTMVTLTLFHLASLKMVSKLSDDGLGSFFFITKEIGMQTFDYLLFRHQYYFPPYIIFKIIVFTVLFLFID